MVKREDIVLVPGTIQCVKNYEGFGGLDIWIKNEEIIPKAKVFIGHSLGASFILKSDVNLDSNFIFINPLIKRRIFLIHFVNWMKFLIFEGFDLRKAVLVKYWMHTFRQVLSLLKVDVLEQMKKIPIENIIIIKGKYDNYFCDTENLEILKTNNFKVIEVEAGHDWNEDVAKAVENIVNLKSPE